MHALYGFFQSENDDIVRGEKELFYSIDKTYELYIWMLQLVVELKECAWQVTEERKHKRLPTADDLNPNTKFINNKFIEVLQNNAELHDKVVKYKVNWQPRFELIRRLLGKFTQGEEYQKYMATPGKSFADDKNIVLALIEEYIAPDEDLREKMEEDSIYFADDWVVTIGALARTVELFNENSDEGQRLLATYKDAEDDAKFTKELFRKTILSSKAYEELIVSKVKNWEIERLAAMDVLLIKMAIAEILNFSSIPVKVSLNEYIELSKIYSTPQSKAFVNGLLDKIVGEMKEKGEIKKAGRGLIE
ncbi:MAG: transcription antitermination factor NusB [Sphingobacteriales bacterium JAD_PAG50586_3]|nr:MAG: transcription antitermination factor NusB [Sphingobacteriales bacterium JAD_PAG50586_3]